ncbi:aldehyde dehydrogenase family protein [Streptomyces sp. ADI96-02]|uniref:aldehyde dehydrogenase family protein n=1 Tax=Streptomyces sp. ADI96-02 TaxID=1522760 RepID=UPI002406C264|nr:aldehyde dehydrogenase family protein [Streptomyces sp. ADI96-02]
MTDPRTGGARGTMRAADGPDVAAAVRTARKAARGWGGLSGGERSRRLSRLADLMEREAPAYLAAELAGTGKPPSEAAAEVAASIDVLRFYAGALRTGTSPAAGELIPGHESWVRWEPLGVVAAIVPWNYPLLMAAWRIGPALAAGNAVILKPAATTPDSGLLLARDAGQELGPGVLQTLVGGRATGRTLTAGPVDAVAFTGSPAAGLDVLGRAGTRRVSLELGGNSPVIVLPDAPADACRALMDACTYNAGQSCAAPARVITLRENHDAVVAGLVEAMESRPAGPAFGPLNNAEQAARYDTLLRSSAASVRRSGPMDVTEEERGGYWRPATVLAGLPEDDPAVREEVFGPLLTVQVAADPHDALRLAGSVPQALAASVWSRDLARALPLAQALDAGEVWVNCHLAQTAELPHGGRRGSGHGTDLSVLALTEYQRPKTVTVRTGPGL